MFRSTNKRYASTPCKEGQSFLQDSWELRGVPLSYVSSVSGVQLLLNPIDFSCPPHCPLH